MARWWLLRHGESTWNRERVVQGQNDESVLTAAGREQVAQAVARLASAGVEAIVTSDLARALESAQVAATLLQVPVLVDEGLRERHYGVLEGEPLSVATPELLGFEGGRVISSSARPAGGESIDDLYARTRATAERLLDAYGDATLLIVTHGGAVRTLLAWAEGREMANAPWGPVGNATLWELTTPSRSA
jgi:probable phosphoglycerate mutase